MNASDTIAPPTPAGHTARTLSAPTPASNGCDLSIVMPCLNEAETLATCIRKARASIEQLGIVGEVVVADNGSTDGSQEIAEREGARVVPVASKGYGSALRGGITAARGRWIIMGDADDSYDFSNLAPFVEKLREGNELVMGCRLPWGGGQIVKGAMPWKHRWIGNPGLTAVGKLFFGARTNDFNCGLRGFTREAFDRMELKTPGMEFASEMVIKAAIKELRVAEVPITLHKDGRSRPPHLRSWRDGWRNLRFMLLHCPRWLFLVPSVLLIAVGLIGTVALSIGPVHIGVIGFDTSSLLVCSSMLTVGLQLAFFGVFARRFAEIEQLLPPSAWFASLGRWLRIEHGIFGGIALAIAGFAMLVGAVWVWKVSGFSALSYSDSLRQVIPAITLMTNGVQISFSSFFLGILDLRREPVTHSPS